MFSKVILCVIMISQIFLGHVQALLELDLDSDKYPFDRQLHEDVLDPDLCQRQLDYLSSDIGLLARFLDAGVRVPKGILTGNTVDLGNFHQCLAINEVTEDSAMTINGKYCRIQVPVEQDLRISNVIHNSNLKFDTSNLKTDALTQLEAIHRHKMSLKLGLGGTEIVERISPGSPLANVSFNLAVCIPRPCSTEQAINGLLFNLTDIGFEFNEVMCRLPDDRPWAAADYVASVLFSLIGLATIISTCYDLYHSIFLEKGTQGTNPAYTSFSVYTNARRLVTFNSSPGSLECLDGVRTLGIIWIILGHSFGLVSNMLNPIEGFEWSLSLQATWVSLAPISVDTFFFLSGLLLVYTTVNKLGRMQLLKNLHVFYLHRLLRMFPLLAVLILFESSFLMRVFDGALWDVIGIRTLRCREFWWTTLFHLQNIVNPLHVCIGVTWYLAIDVQLHILSPIILFWVLTSRKAAWTSLIAGLVAILTASTIFIFFKNFQSGSISPNRPDDFEDYFTYYYVNILTRSSPFFVGMVYGYLLHLWRINSVKVPKLITMIFLLCSLLTVLAVLYCSYIASTLDWDNQLADNFFNSFLRATWALSLGWIIFACVQGRAGPINWFLSLSMWKLPARISYAMYLIHYTIIAAFYSSIVESIHFSVAYVFFNFVGFLFITIVLAFLVTLLIDAPFATLFKLLLERGPKKTTKSKQNDRLEESTSDQDENDKTERKLRT